MTYYGGKSKQSKKIVEAILKTLGTQTEIIEPFCGGCSVTERLYLEGFDPIPSDNNKSLILMIQALRRGWIPPEITQEEYTQLRHAEDSALRGWAGIVRSFSGKWFGGYMKSGFRQKSNGQYQNERQYVDERTRSALIRFGLTLKDIQFRHCDYRDTYGKVYYLDPPYFDGVQGYKTKWQKYHFRSFFKWMEYKRQSGCTIFLSEFSNHLKWDVIHSNERNANNGNKSHSSQSTEILMVGLPPNKS